MPRAASRIAARQLSIIAPQTSLQVLRPCALQFIRDILPEDNQALAQHSHRGEGSPQTLSFLASGDATNRTVPQFYEQMIPRGAQRVLPRFRLVPAP